jgi:imidazolonepropionase-like amidohydrolase
MKKTALKALVLAAGLACVATAGASTTLIQDVRVFDGKAAHEHRSVLLNDGVITDADYHGATPAGARVVSGAGRTLLPGLIDAHTHNYRHMELPLLFGVTTQVDMHTAVELVQQMSKAMAAGQNHEHADMFAAGSLVTAPGGHGTQFPIPITPLKETDDVQAFVDARIAEGSQFIKIVMEDGFGAIHFNSLPPATVKKVVDAAHKRGKLAVVHISNLANARAALEAGADGLAHLFLGVGISEADAQGLAKLAKDKHAFVIPTFSLLESTAGIKPQDVLDEPAFAGLLDKEERMTLINGYGKKPVPALLSTPKAVTAALHKAGVPVLAGTDAGNPGTDHGVSLHHELSSLVDAGLTPAEALAAATSVPAAAFRLGKRGQIANGYKADLVLVEGNPLADITATRHIVEVWKDGEPTAALRERQRARVAQELMPKKSTPLALPADGRVSLLADGKLASPFGIGWVPSDDKMMRGHSSVKLDVRPGDAPGQAVIGVQAQVAEGFAFPWAGVGFLPSAKPMQPADLSAVKSIRFKTRGDGHTYQLMIMAQGTSMPVSQPFTAGAEWTEVSMPLAGFQGIDPAGVLMLGFHAGPKPGAYQFEIADVRLLDR